MREPGTTPYAFAQPQPSDVAQGEFGTGWYYERFSPFSWDWTWRRTLLFGAVAVPFGAMLGVIHGLYAHAPAEGLAVGWRAALATLMAVALGPVLAALVRRAGWSCPKSALRWSPRS